MLRQLAGRQAGRQAGSSRPARRCRCRCLLPHVDPLKHSPFSSPARDRTQLTWHHNTGPTPPVSASTCLRAARSFFLCVWSAAALSRIRSLSCTQRDGIGRDGDGCFRREQETALGFTHRRPMAWCMTQSRQCRRYRWWGSWAGRRMQRQLSCTWLICSHFSNASCSGAVRATWHSLNRD